MDEGHPYGRDRYGSHRGGLIDYDDLDLPDPEGDEDVSEEPTVAAPTDELLAAVTARYETSQSMGEVELELDVEGPEPTLATPPVVPPPPGLRAAPAPAAVPSLTAAPAATPPLPAAPVAAPPHAASAAPGLPTVGLLFACAVVLGLILGAVWMALGRG